MGKMDNSPDQIVVEFVRASGENLKYIDLGADFLSEHEIDPSKYNKPFRVEITKKMSQAGNAFYDYSQNGVPLPDGLATFIRVENAIVPMGKTRPSKNGHPTREGITQIIVGGVIYKVTAYLTESRSPFYVKIIAHKQPDKKASIKKAQNAPRGGKFV